MQPSARLTEAQLHQLGYTIVNGQAVPLPDIQPADDMTLDQLAVYVKGEMENSDIAGKQSILQAHKSAVHLFRAGHALHTARKQCQAQGYGDWKKWKDQHGLANTTVNDAIRLFENAKTEDALIGLGITEAKKKYVYPEKKAGANGERSKSVSPSDPQKKSSDSSGGTTRRKKADNFSVYEESDDEDQTENDDQADTGESTDSTEVEVPTTLASEIKQIAQRLSEISQDDGGKVDWSVENYDDVANAVMAVDKYAAELLRWLNSEIPTTSVKPLKS